MLPASAPSVENCDAEMNLAVHLRRISSSPWAVLVDFRSSASCSDLRHSSHRPRSIEIAVSRLGLSSAAFPLLVAFPLQLKSTWRASAPLRPSGMCLDRRRLSHRAASSLSPRVPIDKGGAHCAPYRATGSPVPTPAACPSWLVKIIILLQD